MLFDDIPLAHGAGIAVDALCTYNAGAGIDADGADGLTGLPLNQYLTCRVLYSNGSCCCSPFAAKTVGVSVTLQPTAPQTGALIE